jgi:hypothetical protein
MHEHMPQLLQVLERVLASPIILPGLGGSSQGRRRAADYRRIQLTIVAGNSPSEVRYLRPAKIGWYVAHRKPEAPVPLQ